MHPILKQLQANIAKKNSYVCVGLDPDISLMPHHLPRSVDGVDSFVKTIIEFTSEHAIAFKANISFFESIGIAGLDLLSKLRGIIPSHTPLIIDGKRGDIGNTSKQQAAFLFDHLGADASTINPYMGTDAVTPFFEFKHKLHFVLVLTSNPGASDFERQKLENGKTLAETVLIKCGDWLNEFQNIGCVVGATQSELPQLRAQNTDLPFLIPGVGAQGGSYSFCAEQGINKDGIALINVGRSVIYAGNDRQFGMAAKQAILKTIQES